MDRAQELYSSMILRGYHDHFHYADIRPFRVKDAVFMAACILFFFLLRYADIAQLIGRLFVR
jgi:cobalt/nickel transport system permease protein